MKNRTPSGEVLTDLILEVFRLNGVMLNAGNKLTKPLGLTSARWQVMGAIELSGHALTVAQIARRMGLARQGVQRIVNDLQKLGLLALKPNVDHKRSALVSITAKGEKALEKVGVAQTAWVNQLSEGLNQRQLTQALKLLQSVRERAEQ
jgi:DNA-binding MarR family transcriptional regulator